MYSPTRPAPAAMPTAASYVRPALYHYAPAPYAPRKYGQSRSLRAACQAAGYSPRLTALVLATAHRRALAGLPIVWPKPA